MKYLFGLLVVLLLIGCTAEVVEKTIEEEPEILVVDGEEIVDKPLSEDKIILIDSGNEPTEPTLSLEALSTHNNADDCWVSYENEVYDVTDYISKHPGGEASISKFCGTSQEFEDAFTGTHGTSKVDVLMQESAYIGKLV